MRSRRACRMARRSFTLIEIMVVVAIIGMILALVGPNLWKMLSQSKQKMARSQVVLLGDSVMAYYLDVQQMPAKLEDLVTDPGIEKWDGPYLKDGKLPDDPWGQPYHYDVPGKKGRFDIYSYGADGAPGGEDDNADIGSID